MWTTNYTINMKFLLFMMVLTLSNAGRIPRSFDTLTHHNFPNLRTVHHGHGATSYQNVDIKNHGKISYIPQKSQTSHHYRYPEYQNHELQYEIPSLREVPYFIEDGSKNHFFVSDDAEAYTSNNIDHIEINNIEEPSAYYDHYEQEYDYGYQ